jgi:hypothetical protein
LPNLSKVNAYMTSSPGFKQLCNDVRHLSSQDSGDRGPTFVKLETSSTGLVHSNTETTGRALNSFIRIREDLITQHLSAKIHQSYQAYKMWLKSKFWPKISPQCTRLSWTCVSLLYIEASPFILQLTTIRTAVHACMKIMKLHIPRQ